MLSHLLIADVCFSLRSHILKTSNLEEACTYETSVSLPISKRGNNPRMELTMEHSFRDFLSVWVQRGRVCHRRRSENWEVLAWQPNDLASWMSVLNPQEDSVGDAILLENQERGIWKSEIRFEDEWENQY